MEEYFVDMSSLESDEDGRTIYITHPVLSDQQNLKQISKPHFTLKITSDREVAYFETTYDAYHSGALSRYRITLYDEYEEKMTLEELVYYYVN